MGGGDMDLTTDIVFGADYCGDEVNELAVASFNYVKQDIARSHAILQIYPYESSFQYTHRNCHILILHGIRTAPSHEDETLNLCIFL